MSTSPIDTWAVDLADVTFVYPGVGLEGLMVLVAVVLCQAFLGSILVVGWTYRLMQRTALKTWWKKSQLRRDGGAFGEFLTESQSFGQLRHWPNWILGQHSACLSLDLPS